jgi:5'-methylthioadenosine/S-adenosylhomocysteine nucleosidase
MGCAAARREGGTAMTAPILALVGALEAEVAPLVRAARAVECERRLGQPVYRGTIGACEVLIAELGIGKVRSAAVLQSLIDHHTLSAVICFGSAGGLNPSLNVGDIIIAQKVTQHDYVLLNKPAILGGRMEWVKTDPRLSQGLAMAAQRLGKPTRMGGIITGDVVITRGETRRHLWETFNADAVEMEGAAVGLVCALNHIPFALIRALSDNADEEATTSFKKVIHDISASLAEVVVEYVASSDATHR